MEQRALDKITEFINLIEEADPEDPDDAQEIAEGLILDGIPFRRFTDSIRVEIEKIPCLRSISLANCKLTSLDNFPPSLPSLTFLNLSDNQLPGASLSHILPRYQSLTSLNLAGNPLSDFGDLSFISSLPSLRSLDLYNNPVSLLEGYREEVFSRAKALQILDLKDRDGLDVEDDEDQCSEEEEEQEEEEQDEEGEEGDEEEGDEEEGEGDEHEGDDKVRKELKTG